MTIHADPADILPLIERVEAGSGSDSLLDRDVLLATYLEEIPAPFDDPNRIHSAYRENEADGSCREGSFAVMIRPLTRSIDAVEILRARLLPGSQVSLDITDEHTRADVYLPVSAPGESSSPARALLAAVLRACLVNLNAAGSP